MQASESARGASTAAPPGPLVAEATPTPGGGSVSAFAAALAAALGQMLAGLSRKKKMQAPFVDKLSENVDALRKIADELTAAIDRDASSYDAVMAAFKLPQRNEEEKAAREAAIQAATKGATEVPLEVAGKAASLLERLVQLEAISATSMKSDLLVARLMAVAGAKGALANVEINLEGLKDAAYVARMRGKVDELRKRLG